jgi:hypothetical protein
MTRGYAGRVLDAFLGLVDGSMRQANDGRGRQSIGNVHLHLDERSIQADRGARLTLASIEHAPRSKRDDRIRPTDQLLRRANYTTGVPECRNQRVDKVPRRPNRSRPFSSIGLVNAIITPGVSQSARMLFRKSCASSTSRSKRLRCVWLTRGLDEKGWTLHVMLSRIQHTATTIPVNIHTELPGLSSHC